MHKIRYLASVVTQNFSAFGELLAMPKRFAEISGGWVGWLVGEWAGGRVRRSLVPLSACLLQFSWLQLTQRACVAACPALPLPLWLPAGGITRVSEALEVIDKAARLDAATTATAAGSGDSEAIQFT